MACAVSSGFCPRNSGASRPTSQRLGYDSLVGEYLAWILDSLQTVDAHVRVLAAMIGALLETNVITGLFLPGDTAVALAAMAVESPAEGVMLVLAATIGSMAGALSSFGLGRRLGPGAESSLVGSWVGSQRWRRGAGFLERHGALAVFIARFLPIFRTVVPFLVGVSGAPTRKFVIPASMASLVWASGYVVVLATASEQVRGWLGPALQQSTIAPYHEGLFGVALIALIVLPAAVAVFRRGRELWSSAPSHQPVIDNDAETPSGEA